MTVNRKFGFVLGAILLVFTFRVVGQFVQWIRPVSFLPNFSEWQSGVIPYGVLLSFQIVIVIVLTYIVVLLVRNRHQPQRRRGIILISIGACYCCVMLFRLIASLTFAEEGSWLDKTLPSFFHVVLSCFLLLYGCFNLWYHSAGE